MSISFHKNQQIFHLQTNETSYIIEITRYGYLAHLYWGKRINAYHGSNKILYRDRGFAPNPHIEDRSFSLDTLPQEYPQYGNGDFRSCAYQVMNENHETFSDLRYQSYEIIQGKRPLSGLPSTFAKEDEVETLILHLKDEILGLCVNLQYSVFQEDIMTRSCTFYCETQPLKLLRMYSMSLDFRDADFELISMYGAHNNERNMERRKLSNSIMHIESTRGASSAQQNPFFMLARENTNEDAGEVYAFQFVYSGNFQATIQVDPYQNTRVQMGLNPFDNEINLEKDEEFQTPEVILSYSNQGFTALTHHLHDFYQNHLSRSSWTKKIRPILINNWEATYFDFNEEKLLQLARQASKLGIELFVLDDGWFKGRNSDTSSLGDWVCDEVKLPHGLSYLSDKIHDLNMQFGLWFEPEMISMNSELYRNHPEYCMQVENRDPIFSRGQLVLDLSNPKVCDYVVESLRNVLNSTQIDYVKWDMNRSLTNIGSTYLPKAKQRECAHRYILGLYSIMDRITSEFDTILFESCSSGGGRFDLGMLYYMPQIWASDNTDAISRLKIQYASSFVFPSIAIGAHVSVCPNHQVGRTTPLQTRAHVAMSANLGYELDLNVCSISEKVEVKKQIQEYKQIREVVQWGDCYRLKNPFDGNEACFSYVSKDKKEVIVFYFKILSMPAAPFLSIKLKGLDLNKEYQNTESKEIFESNELMYAGISIPNTKADFHSIRWHFIRCDS